MRMNSRTNESIQLQGENIEEVEEFTYPGSKMTADGSSEREMRARLSKLAKHLLHSETSGNLEKNCQKTKICLFKSNVLSILLYG